ncbi:MAG: carbonic anhydrase [Akkermansiaceae bacterium]|jgi:carbonic anhydrase
MKSPAAIRGGENSDHYASIFTTFTNIRKRSPILSELEKAREIEIISGVDSLETGKVTMVNDPPNNASKVSSKMMKAHFS